MAVVESGEAGPAAVQRGANVVQLRAPSLTARQLLAAADELVTNLQVPVVVSARVDVALAAGAAGVNLPEQDLPVAAARTLLGSERLLGRSVHSVGAAREAELEGADYLIFGPIFPSASHLQVEVRGVDALRQVVAAVSIPVVAIGGMTGERGQACIDAGAGGYAGITMFR